MGVSTRRTLVVWLLCGLLFFVCALEARDIHNNEVQALCRVPVITHGSAQFGFQPTLLAALPIETRRRRRGIRSPPLIGIETNPGMPPRSSTRVNDANGNYVPHPSTGRPMWVVPTPPDSPPPAVTDVDASTTSGVAHQPANNNANHPYSDYLCPLLAAAQGNDHPMAGRCREAVGEAVFNASAQVIRTSPQFLAEPRLNGIVWEEHNPHHATAVSQEALTRQPEVEENVVFQCFLDAARRDALRPRRRPRNEVQQPDTSTTTTNQRQMEMLIQLNERMLTVLERVDGGNRSDGPLSSNNNGGNRSDGPLVASAVGGGVAPPNTGGNGGIVPLTQNLPNAGGSSTATAGSAGNAATGAATGILSLGHTLDTVFEQAYGVEALIIKQALCVGLKVPLQVPIEERFYYPQFYYPTATETPDACATRWETDFNRTIRRWDIKHNNVRYHQQMLEQADMICALIRSMRLGFPPQNKDAFFPFFKVMSQILRFIVIARAKSLHLECSEAAGDMFRVEWTKPNTFINFGKIMHLTAKL